MPRNLELKAKVRSLRDAMHVARRLPATYHGEFRQTDTYFDVSIGRLKLRETRGMASELIWYMRPDRMGQKYSMYRIIRVRKPSEIKRIFRTLFGSKVVVKKRRDVYLYKNARIHIDRVRRLGEFVEFEVVVRHGRAQAERLMRFLIESFGIRKKECLPRSYGDMIAERNKRSR